MVDPRLHKIAMKCKRVVAKRHAKKRLPFGSARKMQREDATTKDPRIKFAAVFRSGEIVKDPPLPREVSGKTDKTREKDGVCSVLE